MTKKEQKTAKTAATKKRESVEPSSEAVLDKMKRYSVSEAVNLTRELSKTKFDASVEAHIRLGIDPRKGDQHVRSAVSLPHGTGKTVKIAAFVGPEKEKEVRAAGADFVGGEDLIAEIKKTEKTDFQVAVAEPAMMKNLSQIGKILGTRGLMPSPKNQTVTQDPATAVAELKKGKVSFRNDDTGNIHVSIGKVSFEPEKLVENFETLINAVRKNKPTGSKGAYLKNISISSSMGPGIKVEIPK